MAITLNDNGILKEASGDSVKHSGFEITGIDLILDAFDIAYKDTGTDSLKEYSFEAPRPIKDYMYWIYMSQPIGTGTGLTYFMSISYNMFDPKINSNLNSSTASYACCRRDPDTLETVALINPASTSQATANSYSFGVYTLKGEAETLPNKFYIGANNYIPNTNYKTTIFGIR